MADAPAPAGFAPITPAKGQDVPAGFKPVAPMPPAGPGYSDPYSPVVGGLLDVAGLTKRPGARTPVDVLLRPQGALEHIAQAAVTIPAIYAGGALAGAGATAAGLPRIIQAIAPAVGRISPTP